MPKHIVADISANGYGHIAQLAPILTGLVETKGGATLTLRTEVDAGICAEFFDIPFAMGPPPPDPNMRMKGPLDVDREGLFADYRALTDNWDDVIAKDAAALESLGADLVVSNIAVASLASAKRAGVPSAAICSLNWADIFAAYCGTDGEAGDIFAHLTAAYTQATRFIQLSPHMPMDWLPEKISVGPVARRGRDRRADLQALKPARHYVIATMGGIPGMHTQVPLPEIDGVAWIVPPEWRDARSDFLTRPLMDRTGNEIAFIDLMRSADAIVTKAGYGGVTESAVNATRILYTERTDWCETPMLEAWMAQHCAARRVERDKMQAGDYADDLKALLAEPTPPLLEPSGAVEAVAVLRELV
jgi:hypothetical protein